MTIEEANQMILDVIDKATPAEKAAAREYLRIPVEVRRQFEELEKMEFVLQ